MTPKEAIKILEIAKAEVEWNYPLDYAIAIDTAIEALEKQIPKKPIIKPWSPAICPSCGEELSISLGDGYYSHRIILTHCPNLECLQRLDWGEGKNSNEA